MNDQDKTLLGVIAIAIFFIYAIEYSDYQLYKNCPVDDSQIVPEYK